MKEEKEVEEEGKEEEKIHRDQSPTRRTEGTFSKQAASKMG